MLFVSRSPKVWPSTLGRKTYLVMALRCLSRTHPCIAEIGKLS